MTTAVENAVRNALAGMANGPAALCDAVKFYWAQGQSGDDLKVDGELIAHVGAGPNDGIRKLLNASLGRWDWEAAAHWTGGTEPNSRERRARIYDLLRIDTKLRQAIDAHVPPYQGAKAVIIDDPSSVGTWYTAEFRSGHIFYWGKLREFLDRVRHLAQQAINSIDNSADRILERIGDPASPVVRAARGLVVGYVQSGKTTNFTVVIAKAIDAGYRLIIVLSGTTNLLRNQTQRRLDMELVGVENILRGAKEEEIEHDYLDDEHWPSGFISYGAQPSLLGAVDIHRLTTQEDFTSTGAGLNPLEFDFEKRDRRRPLFDRENLDHAGARVAIVKKQRDRLAGLIRELKAVGAEKCREVPTLIIDDESDQASVNTIDPDLSTANARNKINEQIVEILALLPRAQYIGYTATPFANVFVNPKDPKDIYPKDFIISLERPMGYMGAQEFLDFDVLPFGRISNESAYIRDVPESGKPENDRLLEAMDAFVLTGALKKFREKRDGVSFKHHTMLHHHSQLREDQREVVKDIRKRWKKAGYDSPGAAADRLRTLFKNDFRKVWDDRGRSSGYSFPNSFEELLPFLGAALDEIRRGNGGPVLMVNSAEGSDVPDFDGKTGVWKIVVGGAKLSRGYTIEGLTISYFRRRAKMQDTLMQMGRWFGYRLGYSDLVRLYIGRAEPDGKRSTIDLYEAFKAMCRDEEAFRAQLEMYEGEITPEQVPALVFNSHPRLRPTSRNKMFNARIAWANFDYREPTTQAATGVGRKHNELLFRTLLAGLKSRTEQVKQNGTQFSVLCAPASSGELLDVLERVEWEPSGRRAGESPIAAELGFLRRKECTVHSWLIIAPQVDGSDAGTWDVEGKSYHCIGRKRAASGSRFGVYSDPSHLNFAKWLVGGPDVGITTRLKPTDDVGVLLLYPTRERDDKGKVDLTVLPVIGFGLVLPHAGIPSKRIAYVVRTDRVIGRPAATNRVTTMPGTATGKRVAAKRTPVKKKAR